jgi:hypothetical protein
VKTAQTIKERINRLPRGEVFTPAIFAGAGTRASIDQTLSRLCQKGEIDRIGWGVYTVPKLSKFGVVIMPSPLRIAQKLVENEGGTVEVHGAEAARMFGFTTQMPSQPTFATTGASREISLGKMIIRLRHTAARKMALAGRPAGKAFAALWYLGRGEVTANTFATLKAKLPPEEFLALTNAKTIMPAWMNEALRAFEGNGAAHG